MDLIDFMAVASFSIQFLNSMVPKYFNFGNQLEATANLSSLNNLESLSILSFYAFDDGLDL